MAISQKTIRRFAKNLAYDDKSLMSSIDDIICICIKRYYRYLFKRPQDFEEVLCLGRLKCIQLLRSEHCNTDRDLVPFLFAGVRNQISNWVRERRQTNVIRQQMVEEAFDEKPAAHEFDTIFSDESGFADDLKTYAANFAAVGLDVTTEIKQIVDSQELTLESTNPKKTEILGLVVFAASYRLSTRRGVWMSSFFEQEVA